MGILRMGIVSSQHQLSDPLPFSPVTWIIHIPVMVVLMHTFCYVLKTYLAHSNGKVLGITGLGWRVHETSEQVEASRASVIGSMVLVTQGSVCRVG